MRFTSFVLPGDADKDSLRNSAGFSKIYFNQTMGEPQVKFLLV